MKRMNAVLWITLCVLGLFSGLTYGDFFAGLSGESGRQVVVGNSTSGEIIVGSETMSANITSISGLTNGNAIAALDIGEWGRQYKIFSGTTGNGLAWSSTMSAQIVGVAGLTNGNAIAALDMGEWGRQYQIVSGTTAEPLASSSTMSAHIVRVAGLSNGNAIAALDMGEWGRQFQIVSGTTGNALASSSTMSSTIVGVAALTGGRAIGALNMGEYGRQFVILDGTTAGTLASGSAMTSSILGMAGLVNGDAIAVLDTGSARQVVVVDGTTGNVKVNGAFFDTSTFVDLAGLVDGNAVLALDGGGQGRQFIIVSGVTGEFLAMGTPMDSAVTAVGTAPAVTFSLAGTVQLQDFSGDIRTIPVTVELWGIGSRTETVYLNLNGQFIIPNVEADTYTVRVKANHWLAKIQGGIYVNGYYEIPSVFSLPNGDCNGNNTVNGDDLTLVLAALDSLPPGNNQTDLDGDGEVTSTDLAINLKNLGSSGDN